MPADQHRLKQFVRTLPQLYEFTLRSITPTIAPSTNGLSAVDKLVKLDPGKPNILHFYPRAARLGSASSRQIQSAESYLVVPRL